MILKCHELCEFWIFKQTRNCSIVVCDLIYFPIIRSPRCTSHLEAETTDLCSNQNGGRHRCVVPSCLLTVVCTRRNHAPVALHQTHQITPPSQPFWFSHSLRRIISTLITSNLSYAFLHNRGLSIVRTEQQLSRWAGLSQSAFDPDWERERLGIFVRVPTSFRV